MLGEVAITPAVFCGQGFVVPETATVHLRYLRDPLMRDVLVRDLFSGEWSKFLSANPNLLASYGKELLKKLRVNGRLRRSTARGSTSPVNDDGWCQEAIDSCAVDPLDCIITCAETKAMRQGESLVTDVEKLTAHPWWLNHSEALRLRRLSCDYVHSLRRCLGHCNSVMFIDPHLDPSNRRYQEFDQLIRLCLGRTDPLKIEIHRCRYTGSGAQREPARAADWEEPFQTYFRPVIASSTVTIEVFVWGDFHDRYLITNHVGINLPNGFDIDALGTTTTWSKIGRNTLDKIAREFDPASSPHTLCHRFVVSP